MPTMQAYRFALDPSPRVAGALASRGGARRFTFNWGLAPVKERLARARGEDVGVPWTLPALRKGWNRAKAVVAPWWKENSKEAYSSGLDGLARALQAFPAWKRGKRKGRRVGLPKFRKRGRGRESVRFTTGAIRVDDKSHGLLARRRERGRNWEETKAALRRERARVADIRQDALHQLATRLSTTHGTVVVERLSVSGMARGRLAKSVYDAAMAGIRRQLGYKHVGYGSELIVAPVDYPSNKRCSACGAVRTDLAPWERTFRCPGCGLVLDRDLNAAYNLAALVAAVAGSGPGRTKARAGDVSPGLAGQTPMKREAGSGAPAPGQTGAAGPRGSAA